MESRRGGKKYGKRGWQCHAQRGFAEGGVATQNWRLTRDGFCRYVVNVTRKASVGRRRVMSIHVGRMKRMVARDRLDLATCTSRCICFWLSSESQFSADGNVTTTAGMQHATMLGERSAFTGSGLSGCCLECKMCSNVRRLARV